MSREKYIPIPRVDSLHATADQFVSKILAPLMKDIDSRIVSISYVQNARTNREYIEIEWNTALRRISISRVPITGLNFMEITERALKEIRYA